MTAPPDARFLVVKLKNHSRMCRKLYVCFFIVVQGSKNVFFYSNFKLELNVIEKCIHPLVQ